MMKQMTVDDFLGAFERPEPVKLFGICDDAHCPRCRYGFLYPEETDKERCPVCGQMVSWMPWHRANDDEGESND